MPNMANITVKKADGTTDIVFTAANPSGGDKSPALWRSESAGTADGFMPRLSVWSRENGPGTARRVEYTFSYPQTATDSTTTVTSVINKALASGSFVVPKEMPAAQLNEFAAQFGNLMASALIKSVNATGYAPT